MHASASMGNHKDQPGYLAWGPILRAGSVFAGLAGTALMFVVGGLMVALTGCNSSYGDTSAFCPNHEDLATALELAALIPGLVAPLAGGIASCVKSHPRWLATGYAIAVLMFALLYVLATGQQPLLS